MATPIGELSIRLLDQGDDVASLYPLASQSLVLDRFSEVLFAEKLSTRRRVGETSRVFVAEVGGEAVGFAQSVERAADRLAWLGLFAVAEPFRRRGVGRALWNTVREQWAASGAASGEVLAIPGNYFTPGLDPRYTEAVAFLERMGFERFKDCVNMSAPLERPFDTAQDEDRLRASGVEVRRARRDDGPLLDAYFAAHFGADWRLEAQLAYEVQPAGLHLALRDERVIGFSAHSTQNREWGFFGPMGTAPESRGLGIGRVLLRRCLNDLRELGHRTAMIPWVGPITFYAEHADCRVERVFWRFRAREEV